MLFLGKVDAGGSLKFPTLAEKGREAQREGTIGFFAARQRKIIGGWSRNKG